MKKKNRILLCVLVAASLCFVGCSKKEEGLSEEQKNSMLSQSETVLQFCTEPEGLVGVSLDEFLEVVNTYSEFEMESFIYSLNQFYAQYGVEGIKIDSEDFLGLFSSWQAAEKECGSFEKLGEFVVDEEKLSVSVVAEFEDRKANILFVFSEDLRIESMDVSAVYSNSEILTKAGLNTLLGMGTVFAVLIFLAFLISLMKYTPLVLKAGQIAIDWIKGTEKNTGLIFEDEDDDTDELDEEDDLELIAVITAAIAAQEGTGTDGFVVRSIRRRPSNNW